MAERSIIHVDMDAFYAAVEVLDDPALAGKPVIVGGTPEGRGVVSTASYEARRFGVRSAMSAWRAVRLCPEGVFLRPRFHRYAEVSERIFEIFRRFTPLVEPLSIDEAFLDVTGCEGLFGSAVDMGRAIKQAIRDEIGLTASVGVAPNKFLAKVASDLEKPDGFVVVTATGAEALLAPLSVERMWGVGRKTAEVLRRMGVTTVRDLLTHRRDDLEAVLGSWTSTLLELARGKDDRPVVTGHHTKSVGAERTFAENVGDVLALRNILDGLVDEVAARLRRAGLVARTVTLKARYPDFSTVTRSLSLTAPTARTENLRRTARELLEIHLGRAGRPLRLLGIQAANLSEAGGGQGTLFRSPTDERHERLDDVRDTIRARFGTTAIRWGNLVSEPDEPDPSD